MYVHISYYFSISKSDTSLLSSGVHFEIEIFGKGLTTGELHLSGNHTVTEYEMSGEPYSHKSGWINHSNERISQVMTFK